MSLVTMQFGSHVYGTNTENSDLDYKSIYIPNLRDVILGTAKEAYNSTTKADKGLKNQAGDVDTEILSLKKYIKLLLEGQTVAVDMLFVPESFYVEKPSEVWVYLKANKKEFLHSGTAAFVGYCKQQANKYGIKGSRVSAARFATEFFEGYTRHTPHLKLKDIWDEITRKFITLEHCEFLEDYLRGNIEHKVRMLSICNRKVQEHITCKEAYNIYKHVFDEYGVRALQAEKNENVDWKSLMHAIRICDQAKELLSTGEVTFPRPNKDYLLKLRKGELPYKEVAELVENGITELEGIRATSVLPKEPNREVAEQFVVDAYLDYGMIHG